MNDDAQLEFWIQQYYDRLTYIAYTYVRNRSQAEEIVQESFVNAYRSRQQLRDSSSAYSWLIRIVINQCHTAIRKNKREWTTASIPEQTSSSAEDIYVRITQHQEVYSAIMSLAEKYRMPIILFYFEELSIRDIADALHLGEGTVKTRLARGRKKLKHILTGSDESDLGYAVKGL